MTCSGLSPSKCTGTCSYNVRTLKCEAVGVTPFLSCSSRNYAECERDGKCIGTISYKDDTFKTRIPGCVDPSQVSTTILPECSGNKYDGKNGECFGTPHQEAKKCFSTRNQEILYCTTVKTAQADNPGGQGDMSNTPCSTIDYQFIANNDKGGSMRKDSMSSIKNAHSICKMDNQNNIYIGQVVYICDDGYHLSDGKGGYDCVPDEKKSFTTFVPLVMKNAVATVADTFTKIYDDIKSRLPNIPETSVLAPAVQQADESLSP